MSQRRDRGIALLMALLLLAILVILVGQMTITSVQNRTAADNALAELQNTYGARSGYHQAVLFLQADQAKAAQVDSLHEKWGRTIEFDLDRAHVRTDVQDSERFFNLSLLVNAKGETNTVAADQLRRLVELLRHPPDAPERIIDYMDADSRGEFEAGARNEPLFNLEELFRIEGLDPKVLYGSHQDGFEDKKGLIDFLTVWPKDSGPEPGAGTVNANTAPAEVLACLSDKMTLRLGEDIVAYRNQTKSDGKAREFKSPSDLKEINGLTDEIFASIAPFLGVRSTTFEVRTHSTVRTMEKHWLFVVKRDASAEKGKTFTLLASHRLHDFLSIPPPEEDEESR